MRVRLKHRRLAEELAKSSRTLNGWARRIGVRSGHLSQLANGKRIHPTAATREKLLCALDLEFDDLFEIELPDPESPGRTADGQQHRAAPRPFSDQGSPRPRRRTVERPAMLQILDQLLSELQLALRALGRRPGYTVSVLLNLVIGLGVSLALFQFVYSAMLAPQPYREPDRIVRVHTRLLEAPDSLGAFSWLDYRDLAERASEWIDLAAWDWEPVSLAGGARPERLGSGYVTANLARVLGVPMILGRWFTEEERRRREDVVVLAESTWRDLFGADPAIVGRTVSLDGRSTTVVGVAESALDLPSDAALWRPLSPSEHPEGRFSHWLGVHGRVAGEGAVAAAEERIDEAMRAIGELHPEASGHLGVALLPLRESRLGEMKPYYLSLVGLIGMLLLIVGTNLASLLSTRAVTRSEELALRSALGASRTRLVRGLLVENSLLGVLGLSMALAFSSTLATALFRFVPGGSLPSWVEPRMDVRVIAVALVVTILTVLVASTFPLLLHLRPPRLGSRSATADAGLGRLRSAVTVVQVTLCFVLLVGAGLFVSELLRLSRVDSGIREEGGVVIGLDLLSTRSSPPPERRARFLRYRDALASLPGVDAVGAIDRPPLGGGYNFTVVTVEDPRVERYEPSAQSSLVTPGYLPAAGLVLLEGSDFGEREARDLSSRRWGGDEGGHEDYERAARTVVVSRSFADSVWPQGGALGKRIKFVRPEDEAPWYEIRGVVSDVRHHGLDREPTRQVYRTEASYAMSRSSWLLRSETVPPDVLMERIRTTVAGIDPSQPIHRLVTLEDWVDETLWQQRFFAAVFWAFSALATVLAALGLYGILAYGVSLRRRELGIRMALGASARRVGRMVVTSALRLVGVGVLAGLPLALLGAHFVAGAVQGGGGGLHLGMMLLAAVVLVATAVVASLAPSRRAARIPPSEILSSQ